MVVIEQQGSGGRVVATGSQAKEMVGKTPGNIRVVQPIRGGQIDDFELAEALLAACLKKAQTGRPRMRTRVVVAVPPGLSPGQRRAVLESARSAGAREVTLVPSLIASAIGAGLPVFDPVASLVVDIGGGTTEVGVISLGGLISSAALPIGGETFDQALIDWLKDAEGVLIGSRTAEELKVALGPRMMDDPPPVAQVKGRDLTSGIPRDLTVRASDLAAALGSPLQRLVDALRECLSVLSPEASADILEHGMVLCGGCSRLAGVDSHLSELMKLPVVTSEHHEHTVSAGLLELLDDEPALARVAI